MNNEKISEKISEEELEELMGEPDIDGMEQDAKEQQEQRVEEPYEKAKERIKHNQEEFREIQDHPLVKKMFNNELSEQEKEFVEEFNFSSGVKNRKYMSISGMARALKNTLDYDDLELLLKSLQKFILN